MSATAPLLKVLCASAIQSQSGVPLASGEISFQATDANDAPIPFRFGPDSGGLFHQVLSEPVTRNVINGVIDGGDLFLGNPAVASPPNFPFRITILDRITGVKTIYKLVPVVGTVDNTWDFGSMATGLLLPSIPTNVVTGQQGATGAIGPVGPSGPAGTTTQMAATGGFFVPGQMVLGDVVSLAKATMNACLNANHNVVGGLDVWFAGPPYPGIFPSDFGLTVDAYPTAFSAVQLTANVDRIIAAKDSLGRFPAALSLAGTTFTPVFFSVWDSAHNYPTADGIFFTVLLDYVAWQKSNDITHFVANYPAYETCLATLPRDLATGLIYVDPAHSWVPWAFQEMVGLTGNVTLASVLYYRAATQLAAMYTAAGRTADATRWNGIATTVKASLQASSPLWDATHGMYRAASIGCNSNLDHYGSVLALYCGIPSPAQQMAISAYLVSSYATIFLNGVCLQTVNTSGGTDWASYGQLNADSSRTPRTFGSGAYQNGFWSVANLWICKALAVTSPAKALQYATEQIASAHPMQEWFDAGWVSDGGTANLESPMGSGAYILSVGAAAVATYLALGTNAPYSINGRDYQDGATQLALLGQGGAGVRIVRESAVGVEDHFVESGLGDIRLQFTGGIFSLAYAPWQGTFTPFLTWGTGGVGITQLSIATSLTAPDIANTRQVIGTGGTFVGTQSPGGQLALTSGTSATPKLKFAYGSHLNFALDSAPSPTRELTGQLLRIIRDADESDGTVPMALDVNGNLSLAGFAAASALVLRDTTDGHVYAWTSVSGVLTRSTFS